MAGELLASLSEVNGFLAKNNEVTDALDDQMQVDASNLIKSQLAGVFQPATISAWADPGTTPTTIRMIAARLIAARWYAKQFTGNESTKIPTYAQSLFDEAMNLLKAIRMGYISVVDDDGNVIADPDDMALGEGDYYPNIAANSQPMFIVGKKWG